jgi:hypothetical protein
MNMAGRVTWTRFVLSAIPIYVLIAINVPKWFIKAVNKIRRGFIWKGRKETNGGSCLVAWERVQRPLEYGGLGVLNLEYMCWALQVRWLWLGKTNPSRPWYGLDIPVHKNSVTFFNTALQSQVGRGDNTLFWHDKWLLGCSISDLAPTVVAAVPMKTQQQRTVVEALNNHRWTRDIQGGLSMIGLYEFFHLWDALRDILLTDEDDKHIWRFESSGQFTSRSVYLAFFHGSVGFEPWHRLWKSWAPSKCKVFLWLAIQNKCWTADRLASRGLPHPSSCALCDQEDEDVQHILTTCVFARQFWFKILAPLDFIRCVPSRHEGSFAEWWRKARKKVRKDARKGLNSLIILGGWILWKHRNACVFNGARPCINAILREFENEKHLWELAGARSLRGLTLVEEVN